MIQQGAKSARTPAKNDAVKEIPKKRFESILKNVYFISTAIAILELKRANSIKNKVNKITIITGAKRER